MKLKLQLASAVRLNYVSQIDDPTYVNRTVVLIYRSDPEFVQLANSVTIAICGEQIAFLTNLLG
jgi:hypothetical protein